MPRGDQISRQWQILQLLEARRMGVSVPELAEELESNVRSIYRDMEALELAGFPVYSEKQDNIDRWFFVEGYRSKLPVPLELTELMALSVAADHLKAFEGTIFSEALKAAFGKFRSMLKPEARVFLEGLEKSFRVGLAGKKDYRKHRETIELVNQALLEKRTVIVRYSASSGESGERRIDPYHVWFMGGTIYVVAWCHKRKQIRLFVIDRMEAAKLTADEFEVPEDFSMDEFTKRRFRVMDGKPVEVKVRFTKNLAQYVKERTWHPTQTMTDNLDGKVTLTMTVEGIAEVKSWILSFGSHAEVLAPNEFRGEILQELQNAVIGYS